MSVIEFARLLAEAFGREISPLLTGEFRFGDTRHTVSDVSKFKALGWEPATPLKETLARYVSWLMEQEDAKGAFFLSADREMRERKIIMKAESR